MNYMNSSYSIIILSSIGVGCLLTAYLRFIGKRQQIEIAPHYSLGILIYIFLKIC